jgi:uncharacterized membrane protein
MTFMILVAFSSNINAAIISGSIYDLSLQTESDAIIEINTLPRQLMVSKDGTYSFNIGNGNYTLYAYTSTSSASESVIIANDGNYTLDIILEEKPLYSNDGLILDEKNLNVSLDLPSDSNNLLNITLIIGLISIISLIFAGLFIFLYVKKNIIKKDLNKHTLNNYDIGSGTKQSLIKLKKESILKDFNLNNNSVSNNFSSHKYLDEYDSKILNIIKKEKRITQKDIRSQIPLSEAKISLVISDLEDKGMIRKIKKGRGNILIYIKD